MDDRVQQSDDLRPVSDDQPVATTQSEHGKPDFLPDQYWVNGSVDLESLVGDSKRYRTALSKQEQDIPDSPDGYDLSKLDLPDNLVKSYKSLAHKLGLSKYQTDQLFGEEGTKLSNEVMEYYQKQSTISAEDDEKEYIAGEIAAFGGKEKVKRAVERMDNLFTAMKNRGIMDDEEIAAFKHSTFTNATAMKGFEKVMNLIDTINNGTTVNAHGPAGGVPGNRYGTMDHDAIVWDVIAQRQQAKYQGDHDAIYNGLKGVKPE
jgi:hypothetical protein